MAVRQQALTLGVYNDLAVGSLAAGDTVILAPVPVLVSITGLAGGLAAGSAVKLINKGPGNVRLVRDSSLSAASNRFKLPKTATYFYLEINEGVEVVKAADAAGVVRWRFLSRE